MGSKASDLMTFPLTRAEHDDLHDDVIAGEGRHGPHWMHVARTIELAIIEGALRR